MDAGAKLVWCEARLTNHPELTGQLGLDPATDDAGVVAAAVARWGDDTPRHLLGAFGYAVESADGVSVARDALGVMPAYWARDATGRVHASDSLATLAALDGVDVSPDGEYLAAESVRVVGLCPDRTAMVGVRRVPPGTTVRIGSAGVTVDRWWDPAAVPRREGVSVAEAAAELRALVVAAVGEHMAMVQRRGGDGALDGVAAHLSGGLDSTAVAFVAATWLADSDRSLRAVVSWSPQRTDGDQAAKAVADYGFDERDVVENLAGELGAPVWLGPADLGEALWLANRDPSTFPRSTNMRESWAAEAYQGLGVKHVLSGWGGDEFASFNGRGTNRAIVRAVRLGALRSAYRDRRRRRQGRVRALGATIAPGLPRAGRKTELPPRLSQAVEAVAATHPTIHEAFWHHTNRLNRPPGPRDVQLGLLAHGHLSHRIEAWHQMAVCFSYEYGYPLLDRRLVEWALGMPPEVFRDGGHSRRVFRLAIEGLVPDEIRMGEKADPVLFALVARWRADLVGAGDT